MDNYVLLCGEENGAGTTLLPEDQNGDTPASDRLLSIAGFDDLDIKKYLYHPQEMAV